MSGGQEASGKRQVSLRAGGRGARRRGAGAEAQTGVGGSACSLLCPGTECLVCTKSLPQTGRLSRRQVSSTSDSHPHSSVDFRSQLELEEKAASTTTSRFKNPGQPTVIQSAGRQRPPREMQARFPRRLA